MTDRRADADGAVAVRQIGSWILFLARMGYAAKGTVYIVVGALAARAAVGAGGATIDSRGAIEAIGGGPFGTIALWAVALGLLGYAAWRLINAVTDAERRGDDPSGLAIRAGGAIRGLAYGTFGVQTLDYLFDRGEKSPDQVEAATAGMLGAPAGRWIVIAVGIGIIGYGVYQLYRAWSGKFLRHLELSDASESASTWIRRLGQFGIGARAIVFGMIGALLVRAAWGYDPSEAGGIDDSLDALMTAPQGKALLAIVSTGLIAYGIFQIATARYRRMRIA